MLVPSGRSTARAVPGTSSPALTRRLLVTLPATQPRVGGHPEEERVFLPRRARDAWEELRSQVIDFQGISAKAAVILEGLLD